MKFALLIINVFDKRLFQHFYQIKPKFNEFFIFESQVRKRSKIEEKNIFSIMLDILHFFGNSITFKMHGAYCDTLQEYGICFK